MTGSAAELYENIVLTFAEIDKNLEQAEKELKKISKLRGLEAVDVGKATKALEDFKKDYQEQKRVLKETASKMQRSEYEKTMFGKLETFATEQLSKINTMLGDPVSRVQNNDVLRAVGKVMSTSCTAILCTLNHTAAVGKLAESVLELGSAVHDKVFNIDDPEELNVEEPIKSRGKKLDKLDESLDMVSKCIASAQLDLKDVPDKDQAAEAWKMLMEFGEGFKKAKSEIQDKTAAVPVALDAYQQTTGFGRMEKFAKEWLNKATTFLAGSQASQQPEPAGPKSRIAKAAGNVVKCACNVVVSVLDQAVATGKVAESVVELGGLVRKKISGPKQAQIRTV